MRALEISMQETIGTGKRNMKHVASLLTSKKLKGRVQQFKDVELAGAMKWLGHAKVCQILKDKNLKNAQEVIEKLAQEVRLASAA